MYEDDTIHLTKECTAGIKMAIESINEVLDAVKDETFKQILIKSKEEHEQLQEKAHSILVFLAEDEKEPSAVAKGMSWLKTNVKLSMHKSDATVADLVTEGCNMGIKSLHKYLNEYPAADDKAKELANELIKKEQQLTEAISIYL
ncbi:hypothetical protein CS063_00445 [Sporanaerobium hydrogeniformans]|uniref:Uncharacterized protein n=1 Tax=Sporanaerobium hydrogeniformans TaxID=3072179 RepID=A0AC61DFJ4_9FIRM|nr:hypothetical protein [Sporanaerobium hydrogeniformans]PHV71979.1 hypothetical protein CS063_00445 [Sporanaerobium hydrogeniformans]